MFYACEVFDLVGGAFFESGVLFELLDRDHLDGELLVCFIMEGLVDFAEAALTEDFAKSIVFYDFPFHGGESI